MSEPILPFRIVLAMTKDKKSRKDKEQNHEHAIEQVTPGISSGEAQASDCRLWGVRSEQAEVSGEGSFFFFPFPRFPFSPLCPILSSRATHIRFSSVMSVPLGA
jgi:hypothetical protein